MNHEVTVLCLWMRLVERAETDIVRIHGHRVVWRGIVKMLDGNEQIPNRFEVRNLLTEWYLAHQLSGIRRHSDLRKTTASLARIWRSIGRNPHVLTKERYAELSSIDDFTRRASAEYFDKHYGRGSDAVDADIAEAHVERLRHETRAVRDYVNATIAHLDANPKTSETLQFGQVDEALGVLEEELQALYLLVLGSSLLHAEPVFQYPWSAAFYLPWAPDDEIRTWTEATDHLRNRALEEE